PGQQEEAEEGDEPAVVGAAEHVAEQPQREERQAGRDQREEDYEAADARKLLFFNAWIQEGTDADARGSVAGSQRARLRGSRAARGARYAVEAPLPGGD